MMRAQLQQQQQQQPAPDGEAVPTADASSPAHAPTLTGSTADSDDTTPLRNRAGESRSPYVRRHADTLVAWQPLNKATLEYSTRENKPIFMHIGFLADHHCRLTTEDSFSNRAVADLLNNSFVPILIDRDERPDLDTIYQNYSEAINATGGWPMNIILTPDLYPIFSGIYWPGPGTEHSRVGISSMQSDTYGDFLAILQRVLTFWLEQEERCRKEAFEVLSKLRYFAQEGARNTDEGEDEDGDAQTKPVYTPDPDIADLDIDQLDEALTAIVTKFDRRDYGFGNQKFPNPARLSFLLRLAHFPEEVRDVLGEKSVGRATSMALGTLRRIRDRGLHDHLGAGFMRFSVTPDWTLPRFEKLVGDNALLLGVFLDAWLGQSSGSPIGDQEFADVVFELADYLTSPPVRLANGGFATSEAADSFYRKGDRHMREGAYYLWTRKEFDQVVGGDDSDGQHDVLVAAAHWNVREDGNVPREQDPFDEFINQNVLFVVKDAQELSRQFGIPASDVERILLSAKDKLRARRDKERVRPGVDEKVVVYINGMVISALARTAAAVQSVDAERAAKYLEAAKEAAMFVKKKVLVDGSLRRFFFDGPSDTRAFAEDYAFLIDGLLDLYEATLDKEWLVWASELQDEQLRQFYDYPGHPTSSDSPPRRSYSGGFYSTEEETVSKTILRLKSGMDKLQPSTNAVSVSNLFRLGTLRSTAEYISLAKATINAFEAEILQHPWLFASLLTGVVAAKLGVKEVKLAAGDEEGLRKYYTLPRAEARALMIMLMPDRVAEPGLVLLEAKPVSGGEENKVQAAEVKETQAQAEPTPAVADVPVGTAGEPEQLGEMGEEKQPAVEPALAAAPEHKEAAGPALVLTDVPK
ncbi:hypothetical protein QBC34DRAFT_401340 [Podospora aff. communis PSN243]|uniref:Spermatogenesis-associated protein 20-like TRX domain-containing protein n=1 Tax=Podospora aff. communis PSN243 TaxID=3040156 RepID=A0AAV9GUM9_9PEZI|nr:hypothetical protein QBC34DRAFT_401340 [Podospora aff. communis PSN243]